VRDDTVDVYHVDYGKKEMVPTTAVRDLQARFLALPAQTTRCCLHRVEPTSLAWSDGKWGEPSVVVVVGKQTTGATFSLLGICHHG